MRITMVVDKVKFNNFKEAFCQSIGVNEGYKQKEGASYSQLSSMYDIKKAIVGAMVARRETTGKKTASAFDAKRWANLMCNQVFQINRSRPDDYYMNTLISEADDMMMDYFKSGLAN